MGLGSEKCGVTMAHAGGRRRRERRQRKRGERTRSRGLAAALREREASERDGIRAGRDFILRGPVIPLADSAIPRTMRRKCRVKPNGARRDAAAAAAPALSGAVRTDSFVAWRLSSGRPFQRRSTPSTKSEPIAAALVTSPNVARPQIKAVRCCRVYRSRTPRTKLDQR